ncbi:unnamed protein product [Anisakis simplex]|uniref:DUF4806 domain-containing protein n=1 Tax=Anisakis simplex TaxID=6269 RepID=A0A0M3J5G5_ANISI|nr:unnamed protein product [Anisakis simplex]
MFDSSRQLRASYRRYAIDKLDIRSKAVQKGEQLGDDKLDYRSILPEILRNDDAILDKVKRYLHKHILSIKGKQRPQFIIRHKANEFAQLRRQYPTSKDCPRERVKMIINDVYKEQQWDNPPPSAEGFISSFLYNYSLAFIRTLAESLPGQELTEEKCSEESLNDEESMSDISSSVSQLTTPTPDLNATNKTYPRRSERFYRKRTTADDSTNDNDTTNNNDDTNNDNSDPSSPDIKRKRILQVIN